MKVFECKVCGHIEFKDAPEVCLVCRSPKSAYHENPAAIKKPADPASLTDGDKKHIPVVKKMDCGLLEGCTDVHATVGAMAHVMEAKHFITYLDFYLDYKFISRVWLSPEACKPAASLHLAVKTGKISVIEHCNIHGNWMGELTL